MPENTYILNAVSYLLLIGILSYAINCHKTKNFHSSMKTKKPLMEQLFVFF
jgi:hypothetical protein